MRDLVATIVLLPVLALAQPGPATVRIGSSVNPPLAYKTASGEADGFIVEALREAGRRMNREVKWVFFDRSVEQALSSGEVELWASASITPQRQKLLYMTRPWWIEDLSLVVRANGPVKSEADLNGRKLTIHRGPPLPRPPESVFPGAKIAFRTNRWDTMRDVCTGASDAGLLSGLNLHATLMDRPKECEGVALDLVGQQLGRMETAIAAAFDNQALAEAIYARLQGMAADGTMQRIAARYPGAMLGTAAPPFEPKPQGNPYWWLVLAAALTMGAYAYWRAYREKRRAMVALDSARAASRAKEEFLATVSHEIRTPMNAVLGYLDLLEGTHLSAEQRELAENIGGATSSLLTLLTNMLDFSRLQAGQAALRREQFDLVQLVQDVASATALMAEAKDLEFSVYVDPQTPKTLVGDGTRLRQVMLNLTANAVKFTSSGYVRLEAGWRRNGSRDELEVVVQDTGEGISAEQQAVIFEPFQQLDSTVTRLHGGVGLGLAIVRTLVEMMRGTISVDSRKGAGSRFTISIPLESDTAGCWLPRIEGGAVKAGLLLRKSANATVLRQYLRAAGVETHEFTDEEDLRGWMRHLETGAMRILVFADPRLLSLPERFADEARAICRPRQAHIVLVGSLAMLRLLPGRAKDRFDGMLEWPVSTKTLLHLLNPAEPRPRELRGREAVVTAETVLVVDDNAVNRKVASALLRKLGCPVEVAGDGQTAADMCRRTRYSLVLMDCQMPLMDGYTAANLIRSQEGLSKQVRIIGVSASTEPETERRCLEAGMNGYIPKPVTSDALRRLLSGAG